MMLQAPSRWLRIVVTTLAVVPVSAQVLSVPTATSTPSGNAATRSQAAQAPSPEPEPATQIKQPSSESDKKNPKKSAEEDISQIGNRPIGKGVNFYSLEKEQRLGRELASELESGVRLIKDPLVTAYINRIGQNLVRNSDAKVPFTIKVIDNDEINALALPGGYFYVNSGLILAADNEAELAGVMAHEIAHVACRHATRAITKNNIWNIVSIPLIFAGGPVGYAARQVIAIGTPMSSLKFSRDAEREADLLGLEYLYVAGYDPNEFVQFFEKVHALEKREKHDKQGRVSKLFSTHPMTGDRIQQAQREIATILPAREQYVVSTSEFDEVKARLADARKHAKLNHRTGNGPTLRRRTPAEVEDKNGPEAARPDR